MSEPYRVPTPPPDHTPELTPIERARQLNDQARALSDLATCHARKAMIWAWVSLVFAILSVIIQGYLYWRRHHPSG